MRLDITQISNPFEATPEGFYRWERLRVAEYQWWRELGPWEAYFHHYVEEALEQMVIYGEVLED